MLKSEKGMSKVELVVGVIVVIIIVGATIFLSVSHDKTKENNNVNTSNETTNNVID